MEFLLQSALFVCLLVEPTFLVARVACVALNYIDDVVAIQR